MGQCEAIVFDHRKLWLEAIFSLVEPWAENRSLKLRKLDLSLWCDRHTGECKVKLGILSLGTRSLLDAGEENYRNIAALGFPCLVISDLSDEAEIIAAAQLGFKAYISSRADPDFILETLNFILHGGVFFPSEVLLKSRNEKPNSNLTADESFAATRYLTQRQKQVLMYLRQGRSNKVIGRELDMQEATVKVHVRQIMKKLGVSNRTQAALYADVPGIPLNSAIPYVAGNSAVR